MTGSIRSLSCVTIKNGVKSSRFFVVQPSLALVFTIVNASNIVSLTQTWRHRCTRQIIRLRLCYTLCSSYHRDIKCFLALPIIEGRLVRGQMGNAIWRYNDSSRKHWCTYVSAFGASNAFMSNIDALCALTFGWNDIRCILFLGRLLFDIDRVHNKLRQRLTTLASTVV